MPHAILIGIILATYPYPSKSADDPIYSAQSIPPPQPATEGSVPWQANIQGIQNLMGGCVSLLFFKFRPILCSDVRIRADLHDLITPHAYHLRLTPQHLSST